MARVNVFTKCLGTPPTGMMYGKLISVLVEEDSSILALSLIHISLKALLEVYLVGKGHSGKLLRNLFITPSCANERVKASKGR